MDKSKSMTNTATNAVKISITLNTYLKEEVDDISQELGKSRSGIIADALEYYLDYIDLCLAEKRLNDGSKFISAEEMERLVDEMAD
ncbi:ribbon-helix-helix protein, CopG family [uncultured Campylobacter sp.]|uniref:ribbon-helix-helix protein, CopG family n=1 Tax=uncultured Campylobacter sp. TaxID=218934 RepID=UPI00262B4F7F|nr:ribbon-helix-helix protein, CopG family [uncultured Campylobacter sp.]